MARDISQLHPEVQKLAEKLVSECAAAGIKIQITDCLRNKAEQNVLYAQGRTAAGNIVTNTKYPNSMHNWGIAFDFCLKMDVDGDGKVSDDAYNDKTGLFARIGAIGKSIGLEWGGDWKSFVDKPHFQLAGWGSTPAKLKQIYGSPEAYMKTWYSVNSESNKEEYDMPTIKKGSRGKAVIIWQIIIGVEADGIFGNATLAATKNFQSMCGLVADGIVGPKSWKSGLESVK